MSTLLGWATTNTERATYHAGSCKHTFSPLTATAHSTITACALQPTPERDGLVAPTLTDPSALNCKPRLCTASTTRYPVPAAFLSHQPYPLHMRHQKPTSSPSPPPPPVSPFFKVTIAAPPPLPPPLSPSPPPPPLDTGEESLESGSSSHITILLPSLLASGCLCCFCFWLCALLLRRRRKQRQLQTIAQESTSETTSTSDKRVTAFLYHEPSYSV